VWRESFSGRVGFMHAPYWVVGRHGNKQSCPSNREEHHIVLMNHSRRTRTQRIPLPLHHELLLSFAVLVADIREGISSASLSLGHRASTATDHSTSPRRDRTVREYRCFRTSGALPVDVDTHHCPPLPVERFPLWNRFVLGTAIVGEGRPDECHVVGHFKPVFPVPPNIIRSTLRKTNGRSRLCVQPNTPSYSGV